jgi:hypothetical protein
LIIRMQGPLPLADAGLIVGRAPLRRDAALPTTDGRKRLSKAAMHTAALARCGALRRPVGADMSLPYAALGLMNETLEITRL